MVRDRGTCDISGMAAEWDACAEVRAHMREGGTLIKEVSEKNVDLKTPSRFKHALKPLLVRMRADGKKLPGIDDLRRELVALFESCKMEASDADIDRPAWLLRKNLGFVKLKCRRLEVSIASQLNLGYQSNTIINEEDMVGNS